MKRYMLLLVLFLYGCQEIEYPEDNVIEEYVEEMIEENTGIDIDLSPLSEEEKEI